LNKIEGITCEIPESLYSFNDPNRPNNAYPFSIKWDGKTQGYPKILGQIFERVNPEIVIKVEPIEPLEREADTGAIDYYARTNKPYLTFYKWLFTHPNVSDLYLMLLLTHELEETISLANNGWTLDKKNVTYAYRDHPKGVEAEIKAFNSKYPEITFSTTQFYDCTTLDEPRLLKYVESLYMLEDVIRWKGEILRIFSYKLEETNQTIPYEDPNMIGLQPKAYFMYQNQKIILESCGQTVEFPILPSEYQKKTDQEKLDYLREKLPRYILSLPTKEGNKWVSFLVLYIPSEAITRNETNNSCQIIEEKIHLLQKYEL
jgi:hypothetical protein